jgi:hypothetical protein
MRNIQAKSFPIKNPPSAQLVEVVNELGHVPEFVGQDLFHYGNLVLGTEAAKQVVIKLLGRQVIKLPLNHSLKKRVASHLL